MNSRALVLVFLLACLAAMPAPAAERDLDRRARAILAGYFEADGPGAAAAVVRGGVPLALATYGLSDVDARTPITAKSVFDLASVSKQFTATAILTLAETDKLDIRADVTKYLPDYTLESPGRAVRISDLLHHTAGLPSYTDEDDWDDGDAAFVRLDGARHLAWLNRQSMRRPPGEAFEYNNSGYALLGLVIERISGESYEQYLTKRLFRPAGMRQAVVVDRVGEKVVGAVTGYGTEVFLHRSSAPNALVGATNVYASLDDLIAWTRALEGDEVVGEATKERILTVGKLDDGSRIDDDGEGYAYGWLVDEDEGFIYHTGGWEGTSTFFGYTDEGDYWVIVLSNDEEAACTDIAIALAELME